MLIVYKFGPAFELPDASPFVVKLETWLRMANLPYRTELGDARKSPNRKIPYVIDGDRTIADSSVIIDYLKEKHGDRLNDARFLPSERAIARAVKSMFEMELYFVVVYLRWWSDDDFAVYRPAFTPLLKQMRVPGFAQGTVLGLLQRQVRGQIDAQGMGRHSREEVFSMGRSIIESAAELLGEKPFWMGEAPATIDATVYGMLSGILWMPFENPVKSSAQSKPNLVRYCERIRDAYWSKA